MAEPDLHSPEYYELMAVRCRAQTGVVPTRLWAMLTPEAKTRLGTMTQESARNKLGGSYQEPYSVDGEITAEMTPSHDRAALDDIVGRLPRSRK
jgi:hypothetical protein